MARAGSEGAGARVSTPTLTDEEIDAIIRETPDAEIMTRAEVITRLTRAHLCDEATWPGDTLRMMLLTALRGAR